MTPPDPPPAPSPPPRAKRTKAPPPKLTDLQRQERDDKIIDWRYYYCFTPSQIVAMLNDEYRGQHLAARRPGPPPEITIKVVQDAIQKRTTRDAVLAMLDRRAAVLKAITRYEGIFRHLIGISRRVGVPAAYDPTGKLVRPEIAAVKDTDSIAAARAAAVVQGVIDRLVGIAAGGLADDDRPEDAADFNPISVCQAVMAALGDASPHRDQVRSIFTDMIGARAAHLNALGGDRPAAGPPGRRERRGKTIRG